MDGAQHLANPMRGTQEFTINAGMERDGIGQRVCLHADRTVRQDEERTVLECDYCPTAGILLPGFAHLELPAWYWSETT